ncbi:SF1B family DNA helicase RecD2 [Microvirga pudoricolor]|uniref:SF1B family DNA helicase RecD2 n=1 Tax=Microvirga pudoricolor TaxID=2778729 RepID=UPI001951FFF9|nr:ATP-dependent RecD-like DNA helicase [Microvirga pudoricolor]MBM6594831.1 ATP-dependent RecD-like DNA helicase [Microvirga pudoricolor]
MSDPAGLGLTEHLVGSVERVTFHNDETGFCVLQVKARGHRKLVTLVGHVPRVALGELVEASGAWMNDRHHGFQFRAETIATSAPTTAEDLQRYLGSGLIKGIGPSAAGRLVASFGAAIIDVIERAPHEMTRVHGIGMGKAQDIAQAWAEHKTLRDLSAFLRARGLGGSLLARIYKAYGSQAIETISRNPYRLALDFAGFAFSEADRIAQELSVDSLSHERLEAGLAFVLMEAVRDGHAGLPVAEALARAGLLLEVAGSILQPILENQCQAGVIVADTLDGTPCVFARHLYGAEMFIAVRLRDLAKGAPPWGEIDPSEILAQTEELLGVTYSASQREALAGACRSKVFVVTGGPGVGKTTLVRGLLHVMRDRSLNVALCAPTGRAAKRLADSTGLPAKTIHRLLEATEGGFRRNASMPLDCNLLVVDEASMLDIRLMVALLRALPDHAGLLLVGDVDQLPSIGAGQVLADIIASDTLPVARLREIFRQGHESRIITAAHAINRGALPDLTPQADSDFHFVEAHHPSDAIAKLVTLVRNRIPNRFGLDPVRDVQILCPMNRGRLGANMLNSELQRILNPNGEDGLYRAGWTFRTGDKVMQVRNDYERDVYNGEVGIVTGLAQPAGELTVAFDGRQVVYGARDLDELVPAYAMTIHKAQGSEYPAVIIPVVPQHAAMLQRKLLYTGVTRGSRLVVLLGSRAALEQAVTSQGEQRWTRLRPWLEAPPKTLTGPVRAEPAGDPRIGLSDRSRPG